MLIFFGNSDSSENPEHFDLFQKLPVDYKSDSMDFEAFVGTLGCFNDHDHDCDQIIREHFYFLISFQNCSFLSFSESFLMILIDRSTSRSAID